MRTQEEIVNKIKADDGMFSFIPEVLIGFLTHENALPFLDDEWKDKAAEWIAKPQDRDAIINEMMEYVEFAWEKCLDHRGLSAGRSVSKMRGWLWLLGDDEALAFAEDDNNYSNYGAPILRHISVKYSFPIPDDEDTRRMAEGQ